MNDLLFIRHPETEMAGTFCGHSDPPVNAEGQRQIVTLVKELSSEPITAVVTSDLQRASTPARVLAESLEVPCITCRGLREIGFGVWEGLTWAQIQVLDATFAESWLTAFPQLTPPGGEAFNAFESRVMGEMKQLIEFSNTGLIAVITHAGVMRVILQNRCGVDAAGAIALTKQYCASFRYSNYANKEKRIRGELHI